MMKKLHSSTSTQQIKLLKLLCSLLSQCTDNINDNIVNKVLAKIIQII